MIKIIHKPVMLFECLSELPLEKEKDEIQRNNSIKSEINVCIDNAQLNVNIENNYFKINQILSLNLSGERWKYSVISYIFFKKSSSFSFFIFLFQILHKRLS